MNPYAYHSGASAGGFIDGRNRKVCSVILEVMVPSLHKSTYYMFHNSEMNNNTDFFLFA